MFWNSLLAHPPNEKWEIIWIDDCSTDGTREWLTSIQSEKCKVILNTENQGYAANNNAGAKRASGDTLIFLNNDIELSRGWYSPMKEALINDNKIGFIGNVQVHPRSKRIDHAGISFDLVGLPTHAYKLQHESSIKGKGRYYFAVTAACCLIKKDLFIDCDGFDINYRNGFEDVDLCLRLCKKGYRHWVSYESRILHHVSSSKGRLHHNLKNVRYFLKKWASYSSDIGQKEWHSLYLKRCLKKPLQINFIKIIDACLRQLKLRNGDSKWAKNKRASYLEM